MKKTRFQILEELGQVELEDSEFKKSTRSSWWPRCVAVAIREDVIAVRDTKDETKTTLRFTPDEWNAFLEGVKAGEFDLS